MNSNNNKTNTDMEYLKIHKFPFIRWNWFFENILKGYAGITLFPIILWSSLVQKTEVMVVTRSTMGRIRLYRHELTHWHQQLVLMMTFFISTMILWYINPIIMKSIYNDYVVKYAWWIPLFLLVLSWSLFFIVYYIMYIFNLFRYVYPCYQEFKDREDYEEITGKKFEFWGMLHHRAYYNIYYEKQARRAENG